MARFMLFGFGDYYPGGGMNDFAGFFDNVEELKLEEREEYKGIFNADKIQVLDLNTKETFTHELKNSVSKYAIDKEEFWRVWGKYSSSNEQIQKEYDELQQQFKKAQERYDQAKKWIEETIQKQKGQS
jgi:hypothetical protein